MVYTLPRRGTMRRRVRHPGERPRKVSVFKEVDTTPQRFSGSLCPTNLQEQKELFLRHGIVPNFKMKENADTLEMITGKKRGQIRFDYFQEAKTVLERVKNKYGDGSQYMDLAYGKRIDYIDSSEKLANYLGENNAEGDITVYWTPELTCSARMMWHGPNMKYNRPEARKYSLIIKNSTENNLLREQGITCLADHEIGTHFFRMVNDGFQPWFSDRKKFGLRSVRCREGVSAEEGLAALHTVLNANIRYLYGGAILYYTACKASELNFKDLYEHLETYVSDPEQRWKHVMRCKRGLSDPNSLGGYGNDQCYFEGAVEVLRDLEKIDFMVLYSGKVCLDEVTRVRRIARMDCIRIPRFLRDIEAYKKNLRSIGYLNGIIIKVPRNSLSNTPGSGKSQSRDSQKCSKSRQKLPDMATPTPPPRKAQKHLSIGASSLVCPRGDEGDRVSPPHTSVMTSLVEQLPGITNSNHEFIYPAPPPSQLSLGRGSQCINYEEEEEEEDDDENPSTIVNGRLLSRPKSEANKITKKLHASPQYSIKSSRVRRKHKRKSVKKEKIEWFGLLARRLDD